MEPRNEQEQTVNGIPHRMFDGLDELPGVPDERIQQLLAEAPEYIRQRAAEWAAQQQEQQAPPAPTAGAEQ